MNTKSKFIELPPLPSASISGLREIGYTVNTAIADILDNSITAKAKNIWIKFVWKENDSYISILDDGVGMNYEVLEAAMRPGSKNPNDVRDPSDLGRFSLGLKTASWSQANKLYVWSKDKNSNINSLGWDIDEVEKQDKWIVQKDLENSKELASLESLESGTLIEWHILKLVYDHITVGQDHISKAEFFETINDLEKYLGMIFHRFIEGKAKYNQFEGKLKIEINGNVIEPWDPFFASDKVVTSVTPEEKIEFKDSKILVRGHVLPHRDNLDDDEFNDAAGREGWLKQQGFFVYRSDRIIVPGDWLGLGRGGKKWQDEEQYRLARLSIDIPNALDKDWSLDLKKEVTIPPKLLKEKLTRMAEEVRAQARNSFVQRGKYGPRPKREYYDNVRLWKRSEVGGKISYKLNLKHPLIENFIEKIGPMNDDFKLVIRLVEQCIPIDQIWIDKNDENNLEFIFEELKDDLIPMIKRLYEVFIKSKNNEEAINLIKEIEPFNRNPDLVERVLND
ncbi:MAG: ATP-binding protein [Proteobacteria bacterium]|nr:ATP-binding protein [Pseudomonadota bacterium]